MTDEKDRTKFTTIINDDSRSKFRKYRDVCYGDMSLAKVLRAELVFMIAGGMYGALGLWLRAKLYRPLFKSLGQNVVIGRNLTIRCPQKIRLGHNVIIEDNCVIDGKGMKNEGLTIGDNVFIGRNTVIYCKDGDIIIGNNVNISSNCQMASCCRLVVGAGGVIGAYSYFMSGGGYDFSRGQTDFFNQSGKGSMQELEIGPNCWIGAGVIVLDGANIGEHCVIGAGAVVNTPVPAHSLAYGVPAKVIRKI